MNEYLQEDAREQGNLFDDFMFGSGRKGGLEPIHPPNTNNNPNYLDYGELIVHLDTLVESARNLKPLLDKFYPFIEQIWKKK
ncbi:hypothetical protein [Bacillus xiapuensis]|uniref:Uncharacterized protein n=1 Tax=Bacillus xiapuensis TaxID=2014075 RepID=A0ABU6NDJ2_9BACI|nr:hypothetical protein [Bacillus xiapuensis]